MPAEANVVDAVKWAWERFCRSSDALALDPEQQAIANIRQFTNERWGVTIKPAEGEGSSNNREAVGWYDQDSVYLPKKRLAEAAGHVLGEGQIASVLDRHDYLTRRTDTRRIAIRYIPKIGRIDCYALRRSEFGRSEDINHLKAVTCG